MFVRQSLDYCISITQTPFQHLVHAVKSCYAANTHEDLLVSINALTMHGVHMQLHPFILRPVRMEPGSWLTAHGAARLLCFLQGGKVDLSESRSGSCIPDVPIRDHVQFSRPCGA